MQILLRAVIAQILTTVSSLLMFSFIASLAQVLSPLSSRLSMLSYILHLPVIEHIRFAFDGFKPSKRYMIGQTGKARRWSSLFGMICILILGLVLAFIPTAIYQTSHAELRNSATGTVKLKSIDNMQTRSKYGDNGNVKYPVIGDSVIGPEVNGLTHSNGFPVDVMPLSKKWTKAVSNITDISKPEFSGNVSVTFSDPNWLSIKGDNGITTTVRMSLDGVKAENLPSSSPGTLSVQILDNGSPALFDVPVVNSDSSSNGAGYSFVVSGLNTIDFVKFELHKFGSETWTQGENLELYNQYIAEQATFTDKNGTLLFNNTYDYKTMKSYDKSDLESDLQKGGDNSVRFGQILMRNTTNSGDKFQTYNLLKRAVYRESSVTSANNTLNMVDFQYVIQITKLPKQQSQSKNAANSTLASAAQLHYTASGEDKLLPLTPVFYTTQPDYLVLSSLTRTIFYTAFTPETYIDAFPLLLLIFILSGLILVFETCALAYNFHRSAHRAFSPALQLLTFLLYNPNTVLRPVLQKAWGAQLDMVDGYDPDSGYNHLGLVAPEDAVRVTRAEPDVPYGLVSRKERGVGEGTLASEEMLRYKKRDMYA